MKKISIFITAKDDGTVAVKLDVTTDGTSTVICNSDSEEDLDDDFDDDENDDDEGLIYDEIY